MQSTILDCAISNARATCTVALYHDTNMSPSIPLTVIFSSLQSSCKPITAECYHKVVQRRGVSADSHMVAACPYTAHTTTMRDSEKCEVEQTHHTLNVFSEIQEPFGYGKESIKMKYNRLGDCSQRY